MIVHQVQRSHNSLVPVGRDLVVAYRPNVTTYRNLRQRLAVQVRSSVRHHSGLFGQLPVRFIYLLNMTEFYINLMMLLHDYLYPS